MHTPRDLTTDTTPSPAATDLAEAAAAVLARLRAQGPRVHCITNAVAQNFTANVLLAAGCVPSNAGYAGRCESREMATPGRCD